ncbi:MAG: hypothetical protein M1127_01255 [Patescibacteria group bacterium]|nr:hypothetical protein [Patescibacteria group bacterium]
MICEKCDKVFRSKPFKAIVFCLLCLIVLLFVFKAGLIVGFKKAGFSYKWGENYHRNFAGPKNGFFNAFSDREFTESHGVFGQIMKIETATSSATSTIVMNGQNNTEKIVLVNDSTVIRQFANNVGISGLKTSDYIVVIGEPNAEGQIEAKFIRLAPPPQSMNLPGPVMMRGFWR